MSVEEQRNRDLFLKVCFMYFLVNILKSLGIEEEIEDIKPTENILVKNLKKYGLLDNFYDFKVITTSGKIIIFEFKKGI